MKMRIDLEKVRKIHFTGIKGVGMTALALVARDMGMKISGSDVGENFVTDEILKEAGIDCKKGFNKNRLKDIDLLVFSAGHGGEQNLEVQAAEKQDLPVLSHGQALGVFMASKKGICVAGVGGKTSTASMIATLLTAARLHPSYAIGVGKINPLGFPGHFDKKGKYFVAEADEYFSPPPIVKPKFWYLNPLVAVITNIEYDHPDVYKDLGHTLKVFEKFIQRVPDNGLVLACLDNPQIKELLQLNKVPIMTYGLSKKADWQITSINQSEGKTSFSLKNKNKLYKNIVLSVPGEFNVRNAAAAFIVAQFCGVKERQIKQGLVSFKGTRRRFEFIKEIRGIKLYDDYAHHPSQIKATLAGAREWFVNKRIIIVFQPHTYSRTKALLTDFGQVFNQADLVVITDIYPSAREKADPTVSGEKLARVIKKYQSQVVYQKGEKEVVEFLGKEAKRGDIIFTLGAGDIFNWHKTIIKQLES
jgi:UDP-N-acetylmuramate--alanine ligase